MKDDMHNLLMTDLGLNPQVVPSAIERIQRDELQEQENTQRLFLFNTVVKQFTTYTYYVDVLDPNNSIRRYVYSISYFNHQIYTYKQSNIALTPLHDNMQMIDTVTCSPYGYNPSNTIPQ